MKRMLFVLLLVAALLAITPPSLRAQVRNCSTITYQLTTSTSNRNIVCSGFILNTATYNQTWNFTGYCYNTLDGSTWGNFSVSLAATGTCKQSAFTGSYSYCDPAYIVTKTTPGTAGGFNQLYFDALDGYFDSTGCHTASGNTVFAQCGTEACPTYVCATCPPQKPSDCCTCPCGSPILFDVTGEGFNLTSMENGVLFDITGNGQPVKMAWTAKGSRNAFLVLPGVDGLVHNGKQLFGNFTPQPPPTPPQFANGFAALAVYDLPANGGNGDGIIDSRDAIYSQLRLWIDANHDGISQPDELYTLSELGVNSINLNYKKDDRLDQYRNLFYYRALVNEADPSTVHRVAYDVYFDMNQASAQLQACPAPPKKK